MKRNKIISILEYSTRRKLLVGALTVSLIGAGGIFASSNATIANNTIGFNKTVLSQPETLLDSAVTYTVQPGNTLSGIAYKYGVTVSQLQEWNNISNPNVLSVGQTLKIYTNTSSNSSSSSNSTTKPTSSSSNKTSSSSYTTYTVQSGNTLSGIAYKYGVTVSQLQEWNNISNPNILSVGQTLKIYTNTSSNSSSSSNSTINSSNSSYTTYTVESGDTLDSIAFDYGVTISQLEQWNNISNPNVLSVGEILKIYTKTTNTSACVYSSEGGQVGIYSIPINMYNTQQFLKTTLKSGTKITILGSETSNKFYKMEYGDNQVGFIPSRYVKF